MDEYVYLFSNVGTEFPENNIFEFNTRLNTPLLCYDNTEVALVELFFPRLYKPMDYIFCSYLDCIDYSFVGEDTYQILRPVLMNESFSNFVCNVYSPTVPYYVPVKKSRIETLEFAIQPTRKTKTKGFPLISGDIIAVLHFRTKSDKQ